MKNEINWKPVEEGIFYTFKEEGDTLQGEYIGAEARGNYKDSIVHTLNDGEQILRFFGSTVLNSKLKNLDGTVVKIVYLGEKQQDKNKTLKMYDVFVKA